MPADTDAIPEVQQPRAGRATALFNLLVRNKWMMADQALVSGMNFLTTAILARLLGVHSFGVYSVFYIVLLYLNTTPMAINISPMMSIAPHLTDPARHRSFLRGMAGYQFVLSLVLCAGAALVIVPAQFNVGPWRPERGILLPYLLTILCFQAQDWFRRFCYVQGDGRSVFWNDVISYVGQVIVLCIFWKLNLRSVPAAYYAIALTSLIAFVVACFNYDLGSSWAETKVVFKRTWATGRSLLMTTQLQWLGTQGIFLIVVYVAGVTAAGGIRAALALMGPVVMLYQLLDNIIPIRAARAYALGGEMGAVNYLRRTGSMVGGLVWGLIIFASFFAGPIMSAFFGRAYSGFSPLVVWAGLYQGVLLISKWLNYYFRTVDKTQVMARTAVFVSAISLSACLLLTRRYGAQGGLAAVCCGQILTVSILSVHAVRIHRHAMREA